MIFWICIFYFNNLDNCSVCNWTLETMFFNKKGQNGLFTSKSVHEFRCLKNHVKIIFLETRYFDNHFSLFHQSHPGPTRRSFKPLELYGLVGPTLYPTYKRKPTCVALLLLPFVSCQLRAKRKTNPPSLLLSSCMLGFL